MAGLLGLLPQQQDPLTSLLGQYYNPQQARMAWLGGTLQGVGAGLASGRPGAWAQGLALGGGQGLDNYRQQSILGYGIGQRADDKAYQRAQDAEEAKRQARLDAQNNTRFAWDVEAHDNPAPAPLPSEVQLYQYGLQHPDFAKSQLELKRAGSTNIDNRQMGTIPPGYTVQYDDQNRPIGMTPIPGGPAAAEAGKAADVAAAKSDHAQTVTDTILNAADKARQAAQSWSATGLPSQVMGKFGNTAAAEVQRQVNTLKAQATVQNLNQMRKESPTGGALGNVSEGEGTMLAAMAGALDPTSPTFQQDLDQYELTLLRTVHGYEAGTQLFQQKQQQQAPTGAIQRDGYTIEPVKP